MIVSDEFRMFSQEGNMTQYCLLSGVEFLGKLNYDRTGTFYPAFFQLSIGLERLMKIVVIIDHKGKHGLANPPGKMVRNLGHDLVKTYGACRQIAIARGRDSSGWFGPDTVEHDVLTHLSLFAKGARYFNLDSFSERQDFDDPVVQWVHVHQRIANQYISGTRQKKINDLALAHCDRLGMHGYERSITGEWRTEVDCTFIHELFRQANKYCVWTVFRILQPFYFLLADLCDDIRKIEESKSIDAYTVPAMEEFFPFLLCDQSTAMRRRRWVGIY